MPCCASRSMNFLRSKPRLLCSAGPPVDRQTRASSGWRWKQASSQPTEETAMAQEHASTLATAGWFDQAVFGYYPYIALAVLAIGSIIRFDREPYTWRSGSSQLLRRKQLMLGSVLFHLGVLVIFAGHFVGLLTPIQFFDAVA